MDIYTVKYKVYGKSSSGGIKEYLGTIETKEFYDDWQFNNAELVKSLFGAGYINTDTVDDYYFEDEWSGSEQFVYVYPNERYYWYNKLLELERC